MPKVDKPKPTEPRPFNLRSDSRAKARQSHEHPSMDQAAAAAAKIKAQPLNRSILDGPVSWTRTSHSAAHYYDDTAGLKYCSALILYMLS